MKKGRRRRIPAGGGTPKRPYWIVTAFNPLNGVVDTQANIDRYRRMVHEALLARDAREAEAKAKPKG